MTEKILLINPSYNSRDIVYFPLGLGYVAGACNREGIDVEFIDMNISNSNMQQVMSVIQEKDIHVVGIGGFLTQLKSTLELSNAIKEKYKDINVIIGGVQVFGCEQFIMDNSKADILCIGESEIILPQLVHALHKDKNFTEIPSIICRKDGKFVKKEGFSLIMDIDEAGFPLYDIFPMEDYIKNNYHSTSGRRTVDFICSRGCPYNCRYCINSKKPVRIRYRSPENILKEIRLLKDRYAVNDFSFGDEIFTINSKKSLEICEALKEENITWVTSVRADGLNDEIIKAMKDSGCRMLLIGFESGSEKILKSMDKKANISTYSNAIRLLKKHEMMFYSNFMIGMPEENNETIRETENFCRDNGLIFGGSYVTPFPGTKLYDDVQHKIRDEREYLLSLGKMNFSKEPIINLTEMPTKKLVSLRNRTVINTTSYLIKKKLNYVPISIIRAVGWCYMFLFNINNPIISKMVRPITKVIYKAFSARKN